MTKALWRNLAPQLFYWHLKPGVWSTERGHVRVESGDEHALDQRNISGVPVGILRSGTLALLRGRRGSAFLHLLALPIAGAGAKAASIAACCCRGVSTGRSVVRHYRNREADLAELLPELLANAVQPLQRGRREKLFPAPLVHLAGRTCAPLLLPSRHGRPRKGRRGGGTGRGTGRGAGVPTNIF